MLPQYDDPVEDEGVTLDESGRFTGEAERKLEELRKRIQGVPTKSLFEDLNSSGKMSSDYYTQEEMVQFKKPKKKKSLRKKEKLDLDALEAEAISAGLGVGDLGSRGDGKIQSAKEEQERSEAQKRSNAYQSAYAKAEEASKALRQEHFSMAPRDEDENPVFGDDDEDLNKSLEQARKLALKEQKEASGPQAVASLAITASSKSADTQTPSTGETQEDKVVFTEMEEFVWGLQLDEEAHKPEGEDVFMDEDEIPKSSDDQERTDDTGGWTEVKDADEAERLVNDEKEEIVPDETIHEVAVGKGLSGALQLLKERGTLKETVEWGGRNMDKKKSKLVGIYENDGSKEIRIERTDEFGRIMTPKEAFRMISHKFHGKGPGKMKQEKRMKQYQEELKLKQMKNSDTPSQSMERMREAQARLKTPYLVLSGHVKPGQTSDPRSGFATVEDLPGGLTPMLGDRKVEHFLGIKRKADSSSMGPPKKPKT
ncbi:SART-1 protein [Macleaya cordata]|uniref:SART-1 protein n=1 Tax=Macleaya cordata TaxID=56857 RepID=A0A200QRF5_MACCD|nr:SART-1 protein [Macleaya cordata]